MGARILQNAVTQVVTVLLAKGARSAVKYLSPKGVVRATRVLYKHEKRQVRDRLPIQIVLTIGRPNYLEQEFVKLCKKAKEPFPVKNVQIKFPPKLK